MMAKLPDIHQLSGDPFDRNEGFIDRPDPRRIDEEIEKRHALINSLPAGSISGGQLKYDPEDRSTHWMSPDPEERRFAKEFFGVMGPNDEDNPNRGSLMNEGLSKAEKKVLYEAADREVAAMDAKHFRDVDRDEAGFQDQAATLFPQYALDWPELAADTANAKAAFARLVSSSGLTKRDLITLAESGYEVRQKILEAVAQEQMTPYSRSGWENASDAPRYDQDENRTAGIGSGYAGGRSSQPLDEDEWFENRAAERTSNSVFAGVDAWKKKSGFTR
ncbi:hypothetical protein J2X72_003014 [Phyllobacterium sp. 1468]|uniref:hypothetical protein n=1 Tax=Phyllobacterium sp. 1468 TaxID=2817759 RepID=UPI002860AD70|nr:hypothetical protein [Phyllobacterium sp. 1468]MDR6634214.1 hypothetical protein [Phyllobacterium sp. 1468]